MRTLAICASGFRTSESCEVLVDLALCDQNLIFGMIHTKKSYSKKLRENFMHRLYVSRIARMKYLPNAHD